MHFASDNTAPVHPKIMDALARANEGYASSYGTDPIMDEVRDQFREIFEAPAAEVYLVGTGSTANALSLATYCPPWGAVYCHDASHIEADECGAPEFYTGGAKLVLVGGDHGRMDPAGLNSAIDKIAHRDVHTVQPGIVSITNVTEAGAVYQPAQISELTAIAKAFGVPSHMDGARFANALVATGASPAAMTWQAGIDVLSFGGTKNGLMGVEAVVIFDPTKAWEFELRRKRAGHLVSKHRFLSAQMLGYFQDDLWLQLAEQANAAGSRLSNGLSQITGATLLHPTEANMVFAAFPRSMHQTAHDAGAVYSLAPYHTSLAGPGDEILASRFVCSWCTTDENVDQFLATLSQ